METLGEMENIYVTLQRGKISIYDIKGKHHKISTDKLDYLGEYS